MYKLTPNQQKILWAVQHRPFDTVSELARRVGMKDHTARRAVEYLKEKRIIRFLPSVNPSALGLQSFEILLSLTLTKEEDRQKFLQALIDCDRTSLVMEAGGEYEYSFTYLAKQAQEVWQFLSGLEGDLGPFVFEKALAVRLAFIGLGRKIHVPKEVTPAIELQLDKDVAKIDETDHIVLQGLSSQRYNSIAELSRMIDMNASTLEYRIKTLQERQIISRFIYGCNTSLLGYNYFRLFLQGRTVGENFRKALLDYATPHQNIHNIAYFMGPFDYEVGVEVNDQHLVHKIAAELKATFPNEIQAIKILPMFRFHKINNYPFTALPV